MDAWTDPTLSVALAEIARALDLAERELPSSCTPWWSAPSQQAFAQELWRLQQHIEFIASDVRETHSRVTGYG